MAEPLLDGPALPALMIAADNRFGQTLFHLASEPAPPGGLHDPLAVALLRWVGAQRPLHLLAGHARCGHDLVPLRDVIARGLALEPDPERRELARLNLRLHALETVPVLAPGPAEDAPALARGALPRVDAVHWGRSDDVVTALEGLGPVLRQERPLLLLPWGPELAAGWRRGRLAPLFAGYRLRVLRLDTDDAVLPSGGMRVLRRAWRARLRPRRFGLFPFEAQVADPAPATVAALPYDTLERYRPLFDACVEPLFPAEG
jgi:hypothetical protein